MSGSLCTQITVSSSAPVSMKVEAMGWLRSPWSSDSTARPSSAERRIFPMMEASKPATRSLYSLVFFHPLGLRPTGQGNSGATA